MRLWKEKGKTGERHDRGKEKKEENRPGGKAETCSCVPFLSTFLTRLLETRTAL